MKYVRNSRQNKCVRRHWPEWSCWAVVDDWLAGNITVPVRDAALVEPVA